MRNLKKVLSISQYGCGDKLLESHVPPMNTSALSKTLIQEIEYLTNTAAYHKVLSLSANQIRINQRMFAILKRSTIEAGKWSGYENVSVEDYDVVINPELKGQSNLRLKDFEECPTFPGLRFHIWNPVEQTYQYYSPLVVKDTVRLEKNVTTLTGFQARVWDHEVRHLNGIISLDPQISHSQFSVAEDYKQNPAMFQLVEALKQELAHFSEKNMKKMMVNDKRGSKDFSKGVSPDEIPDKITAEMKVKLSKQYIRIRNIVKKQNIVPNDEEK